MTIEKLLTTRPLILANAVFSYSYFHKVLFQELLAENLPEFGATSVAEW